MRNMNELGQALMQGEDGQIRFQAARELARLGKPAVSILIEGLEHRSPGTRQQAAIALGDIGDKKATLPLVDALHNVGWAAAEALGKIGDPRAQEALLGASRDLDPELRRAARDALAVTSGSEDIRTIARVIEQILTSSADGQVGEVLAFIGQCASRPMSSYQQMEAAALSLHHLQGQLSKQDGNCLRARLAELDNHDDSNVRRCAEIIRRGS